MNDILVRYTTLLNRGIAEALGTLGVAVLLFAFLMGLHGAWQRRGMPYLAANGAGALLAGLALLVLGHPWFGAFFGFWCLIALGRLVLPRGSAT